MVSALGRTAVCLSWGHLGPPSGPFWAMVEATVLRYYIALLLVGQFEGLSHAILLSILEPSGSHVGPAWMVSLLAAPYGAILDALAHRSPAGLPGAGGEGMG